MKSSRFIKRNNVGEDGTLVTITGVEEIDVAAEGQPTEMKWCLLFKEFDKPMVLNSTNAQLCEKFLGSDNTDDWLGRKVVVYDEPNVTMSGKLVGGIRIRRAPSASPAKARPVAPPADDDTDEQIPF